MKENDDGRSMARGIYNINYCLIYMWLSLMAELVFCDSGLAWCSTIPNPSCLGRSLDASLIAAAIVVEILSIMSTSTPFTRLRTRPGVARTV